MYTRNTCLSCKYFTLHYALHPDGTFRVVDDCGRCTIKKPPRREINSFPRNACPEYEVLPEKRDEREVKISKQLSDVSDLLQEIKLLLVLNK